MFLVVDNDPKRREETAGILREFYPEDIVTTHHDPLGAVQYVYYNPVDCVFAALIMKPTSGVEYISTARKVNPKAKMFVVASKDDLKALPVSAAQADGVLTYPLKKKDIEEMLIRA